MPHCTKEALHKILENVEEFGIPEAHAPRDMRQAAYEELAQWDAYGPMLITKELVVSAGSQVTLTIVNFLTLLHACYKQGGFFYHLVRDTVKKVGAPSAAKPWSLVLYSDECWPANPLSNRSEKKLWACYASFKEFGHQFLSNQDSWLLVMIARSSLVSKVSGQMGQIMKTILLDIFCSTKASLLDLGVVLQGPNPQESFRLFFKFSIFIQDGASQKLTFGIKGDSGTKSCLKCSSINASQALRKDELVLSTSTEVYASLDRLQDRFLHESKKSFKLWEQASGWSFCQEGLLMCLRLRPFIDPISSFMHDWMHGVCQGCMNVCVYRLFEDLSQAGLQAWSKMADYSTLFVLPATYKSCKLNEIFSKVDSHRAAKKLKVSASDMLTVFPIVRHFVITIGKHASCQVSCQAWLAFCHVLDLLICTMYGHPINPLDLDHAVQKALQLGSDALWEDSFIRKFHWLLHYGDSIRDHGTLIACWAMERKHKRITSVANCYSNLVSYEKSLYVEVLGEELYRLKAGQLPVPGLVHLGKAPQGLKTFVQDFLADAQNKDIYTCSKLNLDRGGQAAQGDVVLVQSDALQWDCGELLKIFGVCKEAFCIIGFYTLVEHNIEHCYATWKGPQNLFVVPAAHVLSAVTWSKTRDGILTLIPSHCL